MTLIPLERIGLITTGPDAGKFVLVPDDQVRTGGLLVFESVAPDVLSARRVFDFWVEQRDHLAASFSESGWNVEWRS